MQSLPRRHDPLALALLLVAACASATPPPPAATFASDPASSKPRAAPIGPIWQSAETLSAACGASKQRISELRAAIKAASGPDEATALVPDNAILFELDRGIGTMDLMTNVHPDEGARRAAEACEQSLKQLASEIYLDRDIYRAITRVDTGPLDPDTKRFVEKVLREHRRAGVDKEDAARARLQQLNDQMTEAGQAFDRNIRDDVRTLEVDPQDLDGLPEDFIRAHPANAKKKVVLDTNYPDFFPVQTYAKREAVRKAQAIAFLSRAPANDAVLARLLALRSEYAQLLGYPSWAAYQAEDKMIKSSAAIEDFIQQLAQLARPRSDRELQELLARKRKDDPKAKAIEVWDRFYYVDQLRNERFGFDSKSVRPYFEFNAVVKGLFDLYGELFGVRFERATDLPVWHPSVIAFRVLAGDRRLGEFYLDLHPREGKYNHAAMFNMVTGLLDGPEPVAALVCNFPDPAQSDGPALMQHSDVRTLFHEFGHLIHHLLARGSRWVNQDGISVEWDFVEAPSQLLEEWVWDPAVLARFAKNERGEPIPEALVAKMRAAEELGKGVTVMRQLHYAALSYQLHARDPKGLKLESFAEEVQKRYSPYPFVPGTHEYDSFGHLEGYSSMYYTYQWSLVIAKDIFTRFAAAGLLDPATAADYRTKILAQGGRKDASELVRDFLGRDSNLDAYRAWLERD